MIWFISAVVLLLFAVGCLAAPGIPAEEKVASRVIGVVLALIALIFLAVSGSYTQSTGETVLIRGAGGNVIDTDSTSGFGWTAPWNKREKWDTRLQRIELAGKGDDVDGPAVPVPSLGNDASINVALVYNIEGESVEKLDNEHRDQGKLEDNRLRLALRDVTATVGSDYNAVEISGQRDELQEELTRRLNEELTEVDVERVEVGDINLPKSTRDALDRVNQRQLEVEEARANLNTVRINGNARREESLADADADQIARCGATVERVDTEVAGATTEEIIVTPIPNAQCQNRLNEQVLISKWIDAMTEMSKDGTVFVLPDDPSQILQLPVPAVQE